MMTDLIPGGECKRVLSGSLFNCT